MTAASPSATRFVKAALTAVMMIIVGIAAIGLLTARTSQKQTRRLVGNMAATSAWVSRLVHDLDEKQLLVDAHIFEKQVDTMEELEARIAAVDADLADALESRPIDDASSAETTEALAELRGELDALGPAVARVLAFSRGPRDAEAQAEMLTLSPRFRGVQHTASRLLDVSHRAVAADLASLEARQRSVLLSLAVLAAAGIAISAGIMLLALREVRRHEEVWHMTTRLTEQNKELDAFAGRVAHDLRGPLTAISLATGQLAEKMPSDNATAAVLRRGITRMETLIRDLLALSRLDAQPPDVVSDPAVVAATLADDFGTPVRDAGGTLEVVVDHGRVSCSDGLLRDVLANLVENALKYRGPAKPIVRVEGHPLANEYEIRVSDNGIGMSEEEARSAFDAFYRGPRAPRTAQGTGLGLSIVKRVVDLCGGRIAIDSKPDHGTTFIIDLPLAEA